jgi:hypothetical protein
MNTDPSKGLVDYNHPLLCPENLAVTAVFLGAALVCFLVILGLRKVSKSPRGIGAGNSWWVGFLWFR